ncbi:hypothetical protein CSW12_25205 [Bacillus cereus]|nr:hypothetical protein CSW12_25205 [Bacillus cereus]PFS70866.1 hypothetical protein COK50_20030 [Bacillus thuringiensis]PFU63849.1 hypothetical protein COK85_04660 [Bacillus thuringiensis]
MYFFIRTPPFLSKVSLIIQMLLFSTYSTLKYVLFIMLNMFHNSTCKRQMSSTVPKSDYVTF